VSRTPDRVAGLRPRGESAGREGPERAPPAAAPAPRPTDPPPRGTDNPKLTRQNRKLLGKHYAARYGPRRGG